MNQSENQRVVVTGLGIISAIGQDVPSFFTNASNATVGIGRVEGIDVTHMNSDRGGEVKDFDVARHFPGRPDIAILGRAKQMALAAARQCIEDAGFAIDERPFEVGIALGYTQGESKIMETTTNCIALGRLDPATVHQFAGYAPHSVPQQVAREFGLRGPLVTIGNACSASSFAMGAALDILRRGEAIAMLAGGADAFSRYGYAGFSRLSAISPDVPRPFSVDRHGMVPAEGAAMLFLETLSSARARGARIYAELAGYGESCDAHHITQPEPGGIARAAGAALADAGIDTSQVSYISTHGTGTQPSDKAEAQAFRLLFGDRIPPVTSIKSMTGHPMGAGSAMECVAALCSMREQLLTPTANFLGPDEHCPVDCVPNRARPARIHTVLKTASAFGGSNAVVIFRELNSEEA
jgi:3-oxoacyl-[acyl-carrier-protein] synthase II